MNQTTASQTPWLTEGDEKSLAVKSLFTDIAPTYDKANRYMSLSLDRGWRRKAVRLLRLQPGDAVLDVCCGTGDFMIPLRDAVGPNGTVTGIDFCRPMLEIARQKAVPGVLLEGDACKLPLDSDAFSGVTVGWGIRNVPDIDQAHREIFRTLKPGGRFASIDMAQPKNPAIRWISNTIQKRLLPSIGKMLGHKTSYTYLHESALRFWNRERLADSMRNAGFVNVRTLDLFLGNLCIHYGEKPTETL